MYTHDRRVTYSEISMKGFADIAQIAEYFQDCSVFQSEVLGMGLTYMNEHHLAWLLASWQIDVDTYPEMGCKVSVSTWPYKFDTCGYGKRTRCKNHTGDCGTLSYGRESGHVVCTT